MNLRNKRANLLTFVKVKRNFLRIYAYLGRKNLLDVKKPNEKTDFSLFNPFSFTKMTKFIIIAM